MFSCKKDKLDGDKEILLGEWEWVHTLIEHDNGTTVEYDTPQSEGFTCTLKFEKRNKLRILLGEEEFDKDNIKFEVWDAEWSAGTLFHFEFDFNGNELDRYIPGGFLLSSGEDTMHIGNYPIEQFDLHGNGDLRYNMFVRK